MDTAQAQDVPKIWVTQAEYLATILCDNIVELDRYEVIEAAIDMPLRDYKYLLALAFNHKPNLRTEVQRILKI